MKKKKRESGYNTNLASEFYVMSMLHRKGFNAVLTLGNKKSVDIVIYKHGKVITLDVKGLIKKNSSFPMDNFHEMEKHFYVFVSFEDIKDAESLPEVYVVPSQSIKSMLYKNPKGNRKVIQLRKLSNFGNEYKNRWDKISI